jgi:hypothetical protein
MQEIGGLTMIRRRFLLTALAAALGTAVTGTALGQKEQKEQKEHGAKGEGQAKKHHNHHDGKQLVGDKIKKDGRHEIDKKGAYTSAVDVKNGKIAGMHVKHDTKGEVPVKKYKTNKDMSKESSGSMKKTAFIPVQAQYLGTTWIGYAYVDDFGNEEIYWFPYDMILDGDTGAVEYIPAA